jgi:6-pyruvoyltetrahydropterin/6-carboxytetrahydropterin synthase
MKYTITQKFSFCYGHRLIGHPGKCRHVHGHTATVEVQFHFEALQDNGMAMDFFEIKAQLGAWINSELDHKLLLYEKDPLCKVFEKEGEQFRKLSYHPTAENLAQAVYDAAKKMNLPVIQAALWESDKSAATVIV